MSVSTYGMTFGGVPVILNDMGKYPDAQRANLYHCPVGTKPGYGWVLLLRGDLDSIARTKTHYLSVTETRFETKALKDPESINAFDPAFSSEFASNPVLEDVFSSEFGDEFGAMQVSNNTLNFGPFYITKNMALGDAATGDGSVYLVEFADRRILAERFSDSGVQQFNMLPFARDAERQPFLSGTSYNRSTPNSWQELLNKLWPDVLGTCPTLPAGVVSSYPVDMHWYGQNPWTEIIPAIMTRLGLQVAYDPFDDKFSFYEIAKESVFPGGFEDEVPVYQNDTIDASFVDVPDKLNVYYNKWSTEHGTERDTGIGGTTAEEQWLLEPPIDSSEEPFSDYFEFEDSTIEKTVKPVWIDAKYEEDNSGDEINADNKTDAAQEIANGIFTDGRIARRHEVYSGMFKVMPGGQTKAVSWYDIGNGLMTEFVAHPGPPSQMSSVSSGGAMLEIPDPHFSTPDLNGAGMPTYPRVSQLVKIDIASPTGSPGDDQNPISGGVFEGRVCVIRAGAVVTGEPCFIKLVDGDGTGTSVVAKNGDFFIGRAMGTATSTVGGVASTRPLYAARSGAEPPDSNVKLVRVFGDSTGYNKGDEVAAVSDCAYIGKLLSVAEDPDFCNDPYTEGGDIWVAKIDSGDTTSLLHENDYLGYKVLEAFTPDGESEHPLYLVQPKGGSGGSGGAGIYRATTDDVVTVGDTTFTATITAVVSSGTKAVSDTVTVQNVYNEICASGAECLIVEHDKSPSANEFLLLNLERTEKLLYTPFVSLEVGEIRWALTRSYGQYEAPSGGEAYDALALAESTFMLSDGDGTLTELTVQHFEDGTTGDSYGQFQTVVTGIDWDGADGAIVVTTNSVIVLAKGTPSDSSEPTDPCST